MFTSSFASSGSGFPAMGEFCGGPSDQRPTFAASPTYLPKPVPDFDMYIHPTTYESDLYDWSLQVDPRSIEHYPSLYPQDPMSTTHEQPVTFDAGRSPTDTGSQDGMFPVMNTSAYSTDVFSNSPEPFPITQSPAQPCYHEPPVFTKPSEPVIDTFHRQTQPYTTGVTYSPPALYDSASQHMPSTFAMEKVTSTRQNRVKSHSVTNLPYPPMRTCSSPVQSVPFKDPAMHICRWTDDYGVECGRLITRDSVPEHLVAHGVKNMAHNHRLACKWSGCRIKGEKSKLNRESMVRHVREKHLGYSRASN